MSVRHERAALVLVAALLWSVQAWAIQQGEPLNQALEELRRAGLQLVFSSALVEPSFKVSVDPGRGSAETIARRILAPHGLTLDPITPGFFAVVRSEASAADNEPAQPPPPMLGPLLEVDVYASRYAIDRQQAPVSLTELTREDLAARPGLDQDALRVTQYLPGTASNAVSARTHVRGGREDETAVYFDGIQLFEPFHYKDVQSFLGILDPGAISSVDFFSGVVPSRFGNRMSGVLDIRPRVWTGENTLELGASLLYTNILSQGHVGDWPVEWLGAVRRSNIGLLVDLLERDDVEPEFLDALGRVQFDIGERSKVALGYLVLDDNLGVNISSSGEQAQIGYRDATGYASWQFQPNSSLETRASLAVTERHTDRDGTLRRAQNVQGTMNDKRRFDAVGARLDSALLLSNRWRLESGAELYDYDAQYDYTATAQFNPLFAAALGRPERLDRDTHMSIDGKTYAVYASALTALSSNAELDVGLRWDKQDYDGVFGDHQVSPRVSFQYHYDSATALRLSWGSLAQAQRPDELQVQDGEAQFNPTQRSRQVVASIERRMGDGASFRFEAFDKRISQPKPAYENVLDPFALLPEIEIDRVRIAPDRARAYGAELSVRWDSRHAWSSWASYSVSRALDYFDGVAIPRTWEQKYSMNAGVAWTRRPWVLSANVTGHSGWRRNSLTVAPTDAPSSPRLVLSPRNEDAWRDYFSLDLRAAWTRKLSRGALESFVELDNVTDHGNLCCVNYQLSETESGPRLAGDTSSWLPRFILLGVTWQLP